LKILDQREEDRKAMKRMGKEAHKNVLMPQY